MHCAREPKKKSFSSSPAAHLSICQSINFGPDRRYFGLVHRTLVAVGGCAGTILERPIMYLGDHMYYVSSPTRCVGRSRVYRRKPLACRSAVTLGPGAWTWNLDQDQHHCGSDIWSRNACLRKLVYYLHHVRMYYGTSHRLASPPPRFRSEFGHDNCRNYPSRHVVASNKLSSVRAATHTGPPTPIWT